MLLPFSIQLHNERVWPYMQDIENLSQTKDLICTAALIPYRQILQQQRNGLGVCWYHTEYNYVATTLRQVPGGACKCHIPTE